MKITDRGSCSLAAIRLLSLSSTLCLAVSATAQDNIPVGAPLTASCIGVYIAVGTGPRANDLTMAAASSSIATLKTLFDRQIDAIVSDQGLDRDQTFKTEQEKGKRLLTEISSQPTEAETMAAVGRHFSRCAELVRTAKSK